MVHRDPVPIARYPALELLARDVPAESAPPPRAEPLVQNNGPTVVFRALNCAFLVLTMAACALCARRLRWLPNAKKPPATAVLLFRGVLALHSLFYAAELLMSDMLVEFTDMALHHVVSLALFLQTWREQQVISVVYMAPYLVHAAMWSTGRFDSWVLALYNGALLAATMGIQLASSLHVSRAMIGTAALLVMTNYLVYCHSYHGTACPRSLTATLFPPTVSLVERALQSIALWGLFFSVVQQCQAFKASKVNWARLRLLATKHVRVQPNPTHNKAE